MIGAGLVLAKTAGGWLAGNWRWAVPAVAFVALGAWSIDRTVRVANLRAEIAQGIAERAQAVLDQKERDRVLAAALTADLADQNARTGAVVSTRIEVIRREKPVIPSIDTPAMRESTAGLRELGFRSATRSGAAGSGDGAGAP